MIRCKARCLAWPLLASLLCALIGCSGDDTGLVPAAGKALFEDGSPVTGEMATIVFYPETASDGKLKSASGQLEAGGSFRIKTNDSDDGVKPGEYRAVLKVWSNYREQQLAIPKRYSDPTTTPLRVKVGSAGSEALLLTVEAK